MWYSKKVILLPLILLLCIPFLRADEGAPNAQITYRYITIDTFNNPGSWRVTYSKYRAVNWDKNKTDYQDDNSWQLWLTSNEAKASQANDLNQKVKNTKVAVPSLESKNTASEIEEKIRREEILPYAVLKSKKLEHIDTIFGFKAIWDEKGYNVVYIEPYNNNKSEQVKRARISEDNVTGLKVSDEEFLDYESNHPRDSYILIPPVLKELYMYVWGSLYDYKIEVILEDFEGQDYTVSGGNINHRGWKLIKFSIGDYVKQKVSYLPRPKPLKLKAFKLTLNPNERTSGAYYFFSYLYGLADIYLESFFGESLENSQRYWGDSVK